MLLRANSRSVLCISCQRHACTRNSASFRIWGRRRLRERSKGHVSQSIHIYSYYGAALRFRISRKENPWKIIKQGEPRSGKSVKRPIQKTCKVNLTQENRVKSFLCSGRLLTHQTKRSLGEGVEKIISCARD